MNADQLNRRLERYGADVQGIADRFLGDVELYEQCFAELLQEPSFSALDRAVKAKDYPAAFSAAHALKGLTGNLGLTPMFNDLSTLTEALRAKQYGSIKEQYAAVRAGYGRIRGMLSDNPSELDLALEAAGAAEPGTGADWHEEKPKREKRKPDKLIVRTVLGLAFVLLFVIGAFYCLVISYEKNIAEESAAHLAEINHQLQIYVEHNIESDWRATYSLANSVSNSNLGGDSDILAFAEREKRIWQLTDVMIFTESGYCVNSSGEVMPNDLASELIDRAYRQGEDMSIVDSQITYTIPVETTLTLEGSPVVAVSAVQNMSSFLDNMGFSSFDGQAYIYLTREDGTVISQLTHASAAPAFNILPLLERERVRGGADAPMTVSDALMLDTPAVLRTEGEKGDRYVVTVPVTTRRAELRLFYFVPESTVNKTTGGFTKYVILLSVGVVAVFAAGGMIVFVTIYRARKRLFDRAILAREYMYDLLVKNSKNAFALLRVNEPEPLYVSSNSQAVVGDKSLTLERTDSGYRMRGTGGGETGAVRQLNLAMEAWDGKGEFNSGYIQKDGVEPPRYFELRLFPAASGSVEYVGIAQDVTDIYQRETAAKDALAMAESANEAKTRFLSNMSHDIRTPMNAIINMTNFAIESIDSPKQLSEYLHIIKESSDHLLHLVNDVLDMSRIESGRTAMTTEPFDVKRELERLSGIVRPLCAARRQTFITDFSGVHTAEVLGDQVKVSQILMNLLSNAVKFTPKFGAVRFTAEELPSLREGLASLRFTVEDNGIGIPKEYLQSIFDPFSRADDRRVSKIEGTGLGLSICHSYVLAMGGVIRCESEEGNGSVFTVELFFERAGERPKAEPEPTRFGELPFLGKRCLLCEDNGTNQIIAKTMLQRLGFVVDVASNGREGVNRFSLSRPGYYDVIYMDIQMPVLDGYQAAVAIRESKRPDGATVPIVAMTANVFAEDVEKARIAGMSGHLGKPLMTIDIIVETNKAIQAGKDKPL